MRSEIRPLETSVGRPLRTQEEEEGLELFYLRFAPGNFTTMKFKYSGECFCIFTNFEHLGRGVLTTGDVCACFPFVSSLCGVFVRELDTSMIVIWYCSLSFFCSFPRPDKDKFCLTWLWPACCGYLVYVGSFMYIPSAYPKTGPELLGLKK